MLRNSAFSMFIISGTCKKHQRQISRCIKHARMAGLIPFQLTPEDYEFYDMVSTPAKKEKKEEVEESLSEKLNKGEVFAKTSKSSIGDIVLS